ncbi:hypothetical protein [Arthrobacter sp. zg-Y238]|uniref:hypothetical protein n=1 Tax=Arthrobacter sp. zg-Y238 TaxID=2964614 RepID=UPI002106CD00|nr:hypothetical protein [Arthrobacter sp. zg-Y238]MCQ1952176.1 hypothetical protein [Arthrobacter sp. zg-Y238]
MSEAVAIVEVMTSSLGTRMPSAPAGPVTHAHYRREPYVRCRAGNGTVDGKAVAWTRTEVLLHWIDDDGQAHNRWTPASTVRRIARDDSAWRDPYDDFRFYYQSSPAAA